MPEEKTYYYRTLSDAIEVPAPDDLVLSAPQSDMITLSTAGEYQRGMLLMSSEGEFVTATAEGLASADEICILASDLSLSEGETTVAAYFAGRFHSESLVLHFDLSDDIVITLRKHGIFLG